jgi:hypothetical protein
LFCKFAGYSIKSPVCEFSACDDLFHSCWYRGSRALGKPYGIKPQVLLGISWGMHLKTLWKNLGTLWEFEKTHWEHDGRSWFWMFCMKCYAIGLIQHHWGITFRKKGSIIFYFPLSHHTNLNEGNGIVQIKIIHMMILIFHMRTLLCIILWIKLRNAQKKLKNFYKQIDFIFCIIISCTCDL